MNCCEFGKCTQGFGCPVRMTAVSETPHDKAARHFWEPNQALHIDVYTGPSRLNRALDWFCNTAGEAWRGMKEGFFNAFRDAWAVLNWCDRNRFWLACVLTGAAIGIGLGLGLGRFFNFF